MRFKLNVEHIRRPNKVSKQLLVDTVNTAGRFMRARTLLIDSFDTPLSKDDTCSNTAHASINWRYEQSDLPRRSVAVAVAVQPKVITRHKHGGPDNENQERLDISFRCIACTAPYAASLNADAPPLRDDVAQMRWMIGRWNSGRLDTGVKLTGTLGTVY